MRGRGPETILLALALLLGPAAACASIAVDEEEVVFALDAPRAGKVYLVGDFNGWNPTMDGMTSREGPWEIRLFLVPGRYRYQFVVDGERISDPDNPHRDPDGMTYFIFAEEDGVYEILYEPPRTGATASDEIYRPKGIGAAVADSAGGLFAGAIGVEGEVGGGVSGSLLVGFDYESNRPDQAGAQAYLLRASARWSSEKGSVEAFHRSGDLDLGDPLSLFGTVGPFRYPLGLFARGAEAKLSASSILTSRIFYANRLDGYRTPAMPLWTWACPGEPYDTAEREDADLLGLSVRAVGGPVDVEYLLRCDRGPGGLRWRDCGDDQWRTGYRDLLAQGGVVRLGPFRGLTATGEYLDGRTSLTQLALVAPGFEYDERVRYDWEEGYRASAGVIFEGERLTAGFDWRRTTLSGDPGLRSGRPDGIRDILGARLETVMGPVSGSARIGRESFESDENTGRVFWLARRNVWLDGDALTSTMIPFLDAPVIWEAELRFEQNRPDTMPGPYRIPGYIAGLVRLEPSSEGRAVYELTAGQGLEVNRLLSLHADMRYVAYQKCGFSGDGGFLDVWFGARAALSAKGWVALGAGVAPHRFDRWLFEFTGDGREAYVLDTGLIRWVDYPIEEELLLPGLEEAEKDLSEEWSIRFEAGLEF